MGKKIIKGLYIVLLTLFIIFGTNLVIRQCTKEPCGLLEKGTQNLDDSLTLSETTHQIEVEKFRCIKCKKDSVYIRFYSNPNTDEIINMLDEDSVFCTNCKEFVNYEAYMDSIDVKQLE